MSKGWQHTHTAADGTPLMLEDGKYYSQWAWDNFGEAYRGDVWSDVPPDGLGWGYLDEDTTYWLDLEIALGLTKDPKKP